ncbi:hypothetical protein J2T04_001240 [Chryseobacterium lathyri]|uniref:Integrase SAM-like N-terminal domain-containing protein n=1 Tax=Chryseobacterium lathyri TaxID=395933 RepID=A0ABT9SIV2_9FLAO|nr:hypothetical protein [Chryseobacterium lathyri]
MVVSIEYIINFYRIYIDHLSKKKSVNSAFLKRKRMTEAIKNYLLFLMESTL